MWYRYPQCWFHHSTSGRQCKQGTLGQGVDLKPVYFCVAQDWICTPSMPVKSQYCVCFNLALRRKQEGPGACWPASLADLVSRTKVHSNRGRHLTWTSGFTCMYISISHVYIYEHKIQLKRLNHLLLAREEWKKRNPFLDVLGSGAGKEMKWWVFVIVLEVANQPWQMERWGRH